MSQQLFLGGKLLKSGRKKTLFNAFVKSEMQKRKENGTVPSNSYYHLFKRSVAGTWMGRETLAVVSREAKESGAWKELPQHEIDNLMESLEDDDTSAPVKVTARSVAADIEGTISRIQPEVGIHLSPFEKILTVLPAVAWP